ncbi:MAG: hypothetical protein FD170_2380 [Bacteroidetes bacterium]|nr:MAG: hypothetical protein FD170_2380 [Bacteroidota bacterium]
MRGYVSLFQGFGGQHDLDYPHLYLMQSRMAKIVVPAEKMLMPGGLQSN